jgi:hypothetical protein
VARPYRKLVMERDRRSAVAPLAVTNILDIRPSDRVAQMARMTHLSQLRISNAAMQQTLAALGAAVISMSRRSISDRQGGCLSPIGQNSFTYSPQISTVRNAYKDGLVLFLWEFERIG